MHQHGSPLTHKEPCDCLSEATGGASDQACHILHFHGGSLSHISEFSILTASASVPEDSDLPLVSLAGRHSFNSSAAGRDPGQVAERRGPAREKRPLCAGPAPQSNRSGSSRLIMFHIGWNWNQPLMPPATWLRATRACSREIGIGLPAASASNCT